MEKSKERINETERLKSLEQHERSTGMEQMPEKSIEKIDIKNARREVEQESNKHREQQPSAKETRHENITFTNQDKEHTYKITMSHMQRRLSSPTRSFSKFIHLPVVEQASDAVGKTFARPSGIMGAGLGGFIGLSTMFYFAKRNGFGLSGFELILFFAIGWLAGIIIEAFYKLLKRNRI